MTELNMINILRRHSINTVRMYGKIYAEEAYTKDGEWHSDLVLVDCEKGTVHGKPVYHWLGY